MVCCREVEKWATLHYSRILGIRESALARKPFAFMQVSTRCFTPCPSTSSGSRVKSRDSRLALSGDFKWLESKPVRADCSCIHCGSSIIWARSELNPWLKLSFEILRQAGASLSLAALSSSFAFVVVYLALFDAQSSSVLPYDHSKT